MTHKTYDKYLDQKYDVPAKKTAVEFIIQIAGHMLELKTPLEKQKNAYDKYDFFMNHKTTGQKIYFETEVKRGWNIHGKWPIRFKNLHIAARKSKSRADIFIMFNSFCDTLFVTSMQIVKQCLLEKKNTIYTTDEEFFAVPVFVKKSYGTFYTKSDGKWLRINK